MATSRERQSNWLRRLLTVLAIAGWALFARLLPHQSISPAYFGRYSPEYLSFLCFVLVGVIALTVLAFLGTRRPAILRAISIGKAIGLLLGSTAIALVAAEVLTRTVDPLGVSMFEEVTKYIIDLEPDDALGVKHRAHLEAIYQGVEFRTNELGLRDRPVPEPSSEVMRVLILGDSVTLGWGVPVESTFAAQLEPDLTARLGRPVRTINAGVAGYNTKQELAFLRRHIESLAPDLIILVYVENDIEPNDENVVDMRQRWENPEGVRANLLRWSWLYRFIDFLGPDLVGSPSVPEEKGDWEESMEAFTEIHRVAKSNNADFVAFLFRMTGDEKTDALHTDIERIANDREFPFFDILPWFKDVQIRAVINSFVDTHPNPAGHRIIAEGIASKLAESGILCRMANDQNTLACSGSTNQ